MSIIEKLLVSGSVFFVDFDFKTKIFFVSHLEMKKLTIDYADKVIAANDIFIFSMRETVRFKAL